MDRTVADGADRSDDCGLNCVARHVNCERCRLPRPFWSATAQSPPSLGQARAVVEKRHVRCGIPGRDPTDTKEALMAHIDWKRNAEAALEEARRRSRMVLLDFSAAPM